MIGVNVQIEYANERVKSRAYDPVVDVLLAVLFAVAVLICHGPSTPVQQIGNTVSCNTNPFRITDTNEYELKSRSLAVCVSTVRHRERGLYYYYNVPVT